MCKTKRYARFAKKMSQFVYGGFRLRDDLAEVDRAWGGTYLP